MFYRTLLPADVLAQLERMQRAAQHNLDFTPSIRGASRSGYPAMNVGLTPRSVEVFAFAPGLDPASIDVQIEKGVLTVAGERASLAPPKEAKAILAAPTATRYPARDDRGQSVTRYTAPTKAELERIKAKADG